MAMTFSEWRRDNSGTLADWKAYHRQADEAAGTEYQVIYRFGSTEVAGIRTYDTREEAEAEALAADDPGLDLAWVEEVPSS